ncbi:MAG TPA: ATP synthase subunit I [Limnochordia bacterium]|nr:ATP synthase subunit I [Limnochordia bacterium]
MGPPLQGIALVALAALAWLLSPADVVRGGILAGGVTGLLNLGLLNVRATEATRRAKSTAIHMIRWSFAARAAMILCILLALRDFLGETGIMAFLVGFFAVEVVVLIAYARRV